MFVKRSSLNNLFTGTYYNMIILRAVVSVDIFQKIKMNLYRFIMNTCKYYHFKKLGKYKIFCVVNLFSKHPV